MELQEDLGEEFDEACAHVARAPEWKGLTYSPLVPIPIGELVPGAVGWRREAQLPGRGDAAHLALVLHPRAGERKSLPLTTARREELAYVQEFPGDPPAALLADSPRGAKDADVQRLGRAIAAALDAE
jgi:hypothetical protein